MEAARDTDARIASLLRLMDARDMLRHGPTEPLDYAQVGEGGARLIWWWVLQGRTRFPPQALSPQTN